MNGVYFCGNDRLNEINSRIYERNVPSQTLQAQFSIRPVSTKYDMMSIIDRRAIPTVPIIKQPVYNIGQVFNPGNDEGTWSGYASNINDESKMKNLFFAHQACPQGTYIPDSTSDMYQVHIQTNENLQQPFPDLFTTPDLQAFNPNPYGIANNFFDNCTRQQIKGVKGCRPI